MGKTINKCSIFITAPEDVSEEAGLVKEICKNLNDQPLIKKKILLDPAEFNDCMPQAGKPEDLIKLLAEKCDILIAIVHRHLGILSHNQDTGTREVFLHALKTWGKKKKPLILLYFKQINIKTLADATNPRVLQVLSFKENIKNDIVFKEFTTTDEFRTMIPGHLEQCIQILTNEPPPPEIPEVYSRSILEYCSLVDIDNLRADSTTVQLRLPRVYVPLYTSSFIDTDDTWQAVRNEKKLTSETKFDPVEIEHLISKQNTLVIKGVAGSGKTTIVKHIAYTIIKRENAFGLNGYLPVLIFLRNVKTIFPDLNDIPPACSSFAELLIEKYFNQRGYGLTPDSVKAYCKLGKVLFLLDGLDEIPPVMRDCIANSFAEFCLNYETVKIVFTGRPHGTSGAVQRRYAKKIVTVNSFTRDQIRSYVQCWWKEVHPQNPGITAFSPDLLIAELNQSEEINDLAGNPLLLTAICFLYLDEKHLPDQRADLYDRFVHRLIVNRFKTDHREIEQYFRELAFYMTKNGKKEVDKHDAIRLLAPYHNKITKEPPPASHLVIEEYFDQVEAQAGLMRITDKGMYSFFHLSIQEYLTAAHIKDTAGDAVSDILEYTRDESAGNMVQLYIGLYSIKGSSGISGKIVEKLLACKDDYKTWLLAGDSLIDLHASYRNPRTVQLTCEKMKHIITGREQPHIRAHAGEILGRLGDDRDLEGFIKVKGDVYELQGCGKKKVNDFELGQYPVTNSWYGRFIKDRGYETMGYWSKTGWEFIQKKNITEPRYWYDRRLNCPNGPVVGVCYYEVEAFCTWLTKTGKDGYTYRLPTGYEWQAAAAGKGGNEYPWGNEWDEKKCNNEDLNLEKTTASLGAGTATWGFVVPGLSYPFYFYPFTL